MPTTRGRNQLLHASGTMPRRAKTKPMRAAVEAMRMSIGRVMVMPTPTAGPLIAAMTGFFDSKMRSDTSPPPSRCVSIVSALTLRGAVEGLAAAAQVGAGTEATPGAGDDDRAHRVVGVGLIEGVDQLDAHLRGEGVELVRAVQRDGEDAVGDLVLDRFVAHVSLPGLQLSH